MEYQDTPNSQATPPMSEFEQTFRLWLAGFGFTPELTDTLCAHKRVAMSIRLQDATGLAQDLPGCLFQLGDSSAVKELSAAMNTAQERLRLICALR